MIAVIILALTATASAWLTDCGQSKYPDSGREQRLYITGGWEARPGEFPYQVSFRSQGTHMCGAVVMNANWVLTAAHCTEGERLEDLDVVLGEHLRNQQSNPPKQIIRVAQVIDHEGYDTNTIENDISLLRMATPIQFNENVRGACEPQEDTYARAMATISGWGSTRDGGRITNELRYTNIPIVSDDDCKRGMEEDADDIKPGMMCAGVFGQRNDRDSCSGDSGGPLAVKRDNKWYAVGLVSWGYGCQSRWAGVYTRVSFFRAWINSKIN